MEKTPNAQDLLAVWECVKAHYPGIIAGYLTIVGAAQVVHRVLASEAAGIKNEGVFGRIKHWISVLGLNRK